MTSEVTRQTEGSSKTQTNKAPKLDTELISIVDENIDTKGPCLFDAVCAEYQLFHSHDRGAFIKLQVDDHYETWDLTSPEFKWLFSKLHFDQSGKPINPKAFKEEQQILIARALFDAPQRRTYIRIAKHGNDVYLDLANRKWEQFRITKDDWGLVSCKDSPVPFIRTQQQAPLPHPSKGGSLKALRKLLCLKSDHEYVLLVSWVVGALNPEGPYAILILLGRP